MGQIVSRVAVCLVTIGLCCTLLFVANKHATLVCRAIDVAIKDHPAQSFITPKEIVELLQTTHQIVCCKTPLKYIDTYVIQAQLKKHPLIRDALVYKTWSGTLKICLATKYFIARIMHPHGAQCYLDEQGVFIDMHGLPLLRLLVINNIVPEHEKLCDKGLFALAHYIYQDLFWRGQITSLQVEDNGKIILGTQVGGHQIVFGRPEKIHEKFTKLALFYSQVIPYKGWGAYHRVNLEFEGQLICE